MTDWSAVWRAQRSKFSEPHFAVAETTLRPQDIDIALVGHHTSVVFNRGTRHYIFHGQKNRDRFINRYRAHGAKPCKDPCP